MIGGALLSSIRSHVPFVYANLYILMSFEWDENKNRANRAKHGIDFAFASIAFDDPLALTIQDRDTDGEQRYQLIGASLPGLSWWHMRSA
jgi:hypothetical protein